MAKLYVSEYERLGAAIGSGQAQFAQEPALVEQAFTFTTSTPSSAFGSRTKYIRVHTDANCSVLVGENPTATTSTKRLAADQTEYFAVAPGFKIAAVTNT